MDDSVAFARLLEALRPWLGHLVIIGGWSHRLHRIHELAHMPGHSPVGTKDADIAFSLTAPLQGDIAAALKTADFQEEFLGDQSPPVTQYRLGNEDHGFYAEFLAPRDGSGRKRNGNADVTIEKAGVVAQKLRHLQLLFTSPWIVRVNKEVGIPVQSSIDVLVPNPVSFIAQKLLVEEDRKPDKKAQDALYIHDTLELFGGDLPALRELWRDTIKLTLPGKTAGTVERLQGQYFGTVTDVIRNAVRIPQDRTIRPDRMQEACAYGLEEIFG